MPAHVPLDWQTLDRLVLAVPVHVLYFDGGLICRYAAPDGDHFLGRTVPELLGAHARTVFPPDLELAPRLEHVQRSREPWQADEVEYPAGPQAGWPAGSWKVHLRPWTLRREPPEPRSAPAGEQTAAGVLVSCLPCGARRTPADAGASVDLTREGERAAVLLEAIRTQLTVIRGFAGLLHRRRLRSGTVEAEIVRIELAAVALGDLIDQYEAGAALRLHHPNLP